MPDVSDEERLARAEPIGGASLTVSLAEAAKLAGARAGTPVQLAMFRGRPVYRFGSRPRVAVFADRLARVDGIGDAEALALARAFAPDAAPAMWHGGRLADPDVWTSGLEPHFPLHVVRLRDAGASVLYVSSRTGEVVMETRRRDRFLAYLGPAALRLLTGRRTLPSGRPEIRAPHRGDRDGGVHSFEAVSLDATRDAVTMAATLPAKELSLVYVEGQLQWIPSASAGHALVPAGSRR